MIPPASLNIRRMSSSASLTRHDSAAADVADSIAPACAAASRGPNNGVSSAHAAPRRPLEGLLVIDCGYFYAAPFATTLLAAGAAHAQEAKIGVILGFTGPIESLTPAMGDSAELALSEVNDAGTFLEGVTLTPLRADSTCVDSAGVFTFWRR